MEVEFHEDGSLQFIGAAHTIDLDAPRRQIIDTLGMTTRFLPFSEVHQVVLTGAPTEPLSLQLMLKRGDRVDLGLVPNRDSGLRLGERVAGMIGCELGGVVRVPTLRVPPQETEETQAVVRRPLTAKIVAADVVAEVSACTPAHVMPDGAPTLEVPTFQRSDVLSLFDEAARDLLDHESG